jgi:hypothetical protein
MHTAEDMLIATDKQAVNEGKAYLTVMHPVITLLDSKAAARVSRR